jgi:AcrR family transcriptional regulator
MARGRPREFDTDRAIDDAMALVWRRGYRATTTRDLERALGVRPSSLYRAFGSKAGVMDAVVRRYRDRMEREVLAPLRDDGRGLVAIDRFLLALGGWLALDDGRGCLIGRLLAEGGSPDPGIAAQIAEHRATLRAGLAAALTRAAELGEIPPGTIPSRTSVLQAMVLGLNLAVQGGCEGEPLAAMVDGIRAEVARWEEPAADTSG